MEVSLLQSLCANPLARTFLKDHLSITVSVMVEKGYPNIDADPLDSH